MSHDLILIMSERIEKEGPVIAKSRIYNLKLNEHTWEPNWNSESKLSGEIFLLVLGHRASSLYNVCADVVLRVYVYLQHPATSTKVEGFWEYSHPLVVFESCFDLGII